MGQHTHDGKKTNRKTSRVYLHKRCNETTLVDGGHFQAIADPLADMKRLYCADCDEIFPIKEFAWEDTGESLLKYYARHSKGASSMARFLSRRDGMLMFVVVGTVLGLCAGIMIGMARGAGAGVIMSLILMVAGLIAGFCLQAFIVAPMILKMVCGTADPRQLE